MVRGVDHKGHTGFSVPSRAVHDWTVPFRHTRTNLLAGPNAGQDASGPVPLFRHEQGVLGEGPPG